MSADADAVVGVVMTPDGVAEITRADALGYWFAFDCALASGDNDALMRLSKELDDAPDGTNPVVTQKAFAVLLSSVVRPALELLGPQAEPLLVMFRNCADEFKSMTDMR